MKKLNFILIIGVFLTTIIKAQTQWINYSNADYVNAIVVEDNNIWAGTGGSGGGLIKIDKTTGNTVFYNSANSGLPSNNVWSLAIDSNGTKWIGTYGGGITSFDGTTWAVYDSSNSGLPYDYINAIAIDGSGTKWIGTYGEGLAHFDGTTWTTYNMSNSGLPNNYINAIAIDGSGTKWIGTNGGGLARFDGTIWTVYNTSNSGLPSDSVLSLAIDSSRIKWIGTDGGGLARYDDTTWTVYNTSNSGLPNEVRSIVIDSSGTKWIGTWGCLSRYDGTSWTVYNTSNSGMPSDYVLSLAIDGSETKWIGTVDGGLAAFNENGINNSVNEQLNAESDMIIYPNPAQNQLTVVARNQSSITDLSIMDMTGKVRLQTRFSHVIPNVSEESQTLRFPESSSGQAAQRDKVIVNIKSLPAGLYILKVTGDKGTAVTKFVKE